MIGCFAVFIGYTIYYYFPLISMYLLGIALATFSGAVAIELYYKKFNKSPYNTASGRG
jgi:hypothetical protein